MNSQRFFDQYSEQFEPFEWFVVDEESNEEPADQACDRIIEGAELERLKFLSGLNEHPLNPEIAEAVGLTDHEDEIDTIIIEPAAEVVEVELEFQEEALPPWDFSRCQRLRVLGVIWKWLKRCPNGLAIQMDAAKKIVTLAKDWWNITDLKPGDFQPEARPVLEAMLEPLGREGRAALHQGTPIQRAFQNYNELADQIELIMLEAAYPYWSVRMTSLLEEAVRSYAGYHAVVHKALETEARFLGHMADQLPQTRLANFHGRDTRDSAGRYERARTFIRLHNRQKAQIRAEEEPRQSSG